MNNWQDWVVGVLVVLCIARVIYGIFRFFRRTRENQNPCDSCVSGCELKDMIDKKRGECDVKKKSKKKKIISNSHSINNFNRIFSDLGGLSKRKNNRQFYNKPTKQNMEYIYSFDIKRFIKTHKSNSI